MEFSKRHQAPASRSRITSYNVCYTKLLRAVYGRASQDENASLPPVADREQVRTLEVAESALQTKPPARYTEATLLSAMEGAGKLVEDDELRAAMEAKGLGTPATRAAIIEGLIREEYVHRNGRELVPTPKAFSLLFALRHFGVTESYNFV